MNDPLNILSREYYRWLNAPVNDRPYAIVLPPEVAKALLDRRECKAPCVLTYDEDGKLPTPIQITCRLPEGHPREHSNGYTHWAAQRNGSPEAGS